MSITAERWVDEFPGDDDPTPVNSRLRAEVLRIRGERQSVSKTWPQQHPYPTPDDRRERLAVLEEAIQRHHDNGYPPPAEWVEEARVHRADLGGE